MRYLLTLLIVLGADFIQAQTIGLLQHDAASMDNGYVLFAPISSNNTYLIDKCGILQHSWSSNYKPGQSVYLLTDGTLLRTGNANNTTFTAGGKGGIIEKRDWNNNLLWTYTLSTSTECQHHDVKALPNGNVLIISWELKSIPEATNAGRNPSLLGTNVWSEKIIEVQPSGTSGGTVVWEWHLWDHLVQDFDSTKQNYDVIANHPERINLNYGASATNSDWIHLNSIDYNASLDQILISSHSFNEIWIIDHSTTTAQAASHQGGNANRGGDILYRWGNPAAYNLGTVATKKFFGQHNAHWIESGLPYANQIMVFNNGLGRPGGNYSTVEIIEPPQTGFTYNDASLPYLPAQASWMYNNGNTYSYYAQNISGAQQLSNGNVLLCNGPTGVFTEVDSLGNQVWKYVNPVSNTGILSQNSVASNNLVFRCTFYPSSYSGFSNASFSGSNPIENFNNTSTTCQMNVGLQALKREPLDISFSSETITINKVPLGTELTIYTTLGMILHHSIASTEALTIPTNTYPTGIYLLTWIDREEHLHTTKFFLPER